jgi:hypothetical protein
VKPAGQSGTIHAAEDELPTDEVEPAGQTRHDAAAVAASVAEYVPAPQSVHSEEPVSLLYFPAMHAEQTPPSGPVYPMLQVQPVDELHTVQVEPELAGQATHAAADVAAVVVEYVPAPQSMHAAEPVVSLYFPATHTRHTGQNPVT